MTSDAKLTIKIGANAREYERELRKIETSTTRTFSTLKRTVAASAAVFAAAGAGAAFSLNRFTEFEDALIGVQKTTDLAGQELNQLRTNITGLSNELGQSQAALLGIAESAGQLGVRGAEDLTKFTETIAKLNVASASLQGEQAAQQIARILTITGEGFDNVDRFASVIARLGDNFATTEAAIAFTTLEISKAGAQFGVSASQAAGLAAAFEQLGVQPELARSTIVQSFLAIDAAIRGGGEEMEKLQAITRMTGDQLQTTFKENSVEVFQAFLSGLNSVQEQGGSAAEVLDEFGLGGTRLLAVLPTLAKGNQEVARALQLQAEEYENATKLNEEFARKTEAASFAYDKLKVAINNAAIEIGEFIAPAAVEFAEALTDEINALREGTSRFTPLLREVGVQVNNLTQGFIALGTIISGVATIITESLGSAFAFILSGIRDVQARFAGFSASLNQGLATLPFIGDERRANFEKAAAEALAAQERYQTQSTALALEATKFFVDQETARFLGVQEGLKSQQEAEEEAAEAAAQRRAERDEQELQALRDKREQEFQINSDAKAREEEEGVNLDIFSQTDEQFEESLERFAERLQSLGDIEAESIKSRLANAKDATERRKILEKEIVDAKTDRFKAEEALDDAIVDSAFGALNQIVGDNKAAQTALFLARKAAAIGKIIINGQEAASLALATLPPPAGEAVAAQRIAAAKAQAAIVAASALPELVGTIAAQEGGIVPGGFGGGDRVPAFLEPGEIIVPQRLNPLSPNFDQTFGDGGLFGGGAETRVIIGFEDEASRFITLKQREDRVLGRQR